MGVCAFLIGMFMVYRQRLAKTQQEVFDPVTVTQPVVALAKPIPSLSVKLTIVSGLQKGQTFQLPVGENTTLGRSSQCDLCLVEDVEISAQHAMLQYLENKLSIRDLNSTNSTLVNGVPIHNTFPLKSGDLILLGRTELRIEFSGKA
jgi:predicted component of type VI protein secretion system